MSRDHRVPPPQIGLASDVRNTPLGIVELVHAVFGGPPDLDPCSNTSSIVGARRSVALPDDGLVIEWTGQVYCNPPYSLPRPWILKSIDHSMHGGEVMLLIKLDPSTRAWADLWAASPSVCLIGKRLRFPDAHGVARSTADFPSALALLSQDATRHGEFWRRSSALGKVVR
jgi:hypothetical protein